ncbi:MAG: hypothetical protein JWM21_975 [Acidobacteria bacterium]|nr:hypothetical protein [Acidobacteriota bacterium]
MEHRSTILTNGDSDTKRLWASLAIVVVLLCTVVSLRAEGRLWICACGRFSIWAGEVCSANNSQQFLDPYSFTHVLHGFLYAWLLMLILPRLAAAWQLWFAVTLGSLWELFENSDFVINRYRTETAALGYQGDTIVNSFGDILCCVVGFMIARRLGWRRSVLVFFAVEFVLLIWIRDSLLLEILMLIRPSGFLKAWQMCH